MESRAPSAIMDSNNKVKTVFKKRKNAINKKNNNTTIDIISIHDGADMVHTGTAASQPQLVKMSHFYSVLEQKLDGFILF